jgi:hypothetical protein
MASKKGKKWWKNRKEWVDKKGRAWTRKEVV